MRAAAQNDMFGTHQYEHLWPYWKERVREGIVEVFFWRHAVETTAWSMATQFYSFARLLFMNGQITKDELRRYFRFHRRVLRWEARKEAA